MSGKVEHSSEQEKKVVTVFQHPDVPFLKISLNPGSGGAARCEGGDERERGGERTSCRSSLRRPAPTVGGARTGLAPPREAKARSLSPARDRPALPSGRPEPPKPKRSFIDCGAARLYERAADLRSSLEAPHCRVPSVRDTQVESVSLPSSPMNSRKIGLSYMTPPTARKLGSSVSPGTPAKHEEAHAKPPKLATNLLRTETRSSAPVQPIPTPFTFHLRGPEQPSSQPSSRSSSPGPFTSMLRASTPASPGLPRASTPASPGPATVAERVSRLDAPKADTRRAVSPTPLGNLRLPPAREPGQAQHNTLLQDGRSLGKNSLGEVFGRAFIFSRYS